MYSSARPSHLKTLDTIQNQRLRIAFNAYRTSLAASLRMKANKRPIDLRHLQLTMIYNTKYHAIDSNPARQSTENASRDARFVCLFYFQFSSMISASKCSSVRTSVTSVKTRLSTRVSTHDSHFLCAKNGFKQLP